MAKTKKVETVAPIGSLTPSPEGTDPVRIVILQRGWVVVGRYRKNDSECSLRNGHVVRTWGTTKGLGEIAAGGPTANTVLDPIPLSYFHELTVVFSMACDEQKWAQSCPA